MSVSNPYGTYIAYRENNSWTDEKGASKFFAEIIVQGSLGKGDKGCVFNGFYVQPKTGLTVTVSPITPGLNNSEGHCMVSYNDYAFMCWQENAYDIVLKGVSQTLSRISYIVAYVDLDVEFEEGEHITDCPGTLKFAEVAGSNASTPSEPTQNQIKAVVGQNNPYIILARIQVGANLSTVTSSLITDLRFLPKLSKTITLEDNSGIYVAGLEQPSGKNLKISVIGPNDPYPTPASGEQILVIQTKA